MIDKFTALTPANGLMAEKLNEVIDAVNELYYRAGRNAPKTPQNNENIPVREEMTVAQLRERLKQGDGAAQELVNDLISELPNQITNWVEKEFTRDHADHLTPEQFEAFWDWMCDEWCLVDYEAEIRAALEHWSTVCADE